MNLFIIPAITLTVYLIMTAVILRQRGYKVLSRSFAFYFLALAFWQFCALMVRVYSLSEQPEMVLFWYQMTVPAIPACFILIFIIINAFRRDSSRNWLCLLGYYLIAAFIGMAFFSGDWFMQGVTLHDSGIYVPSFGPLILLTAVVVIIYLAVSLYDLWNDYNKLLEPTIRSRVHYLIICIFLIIFAIASNFIFDFQGHPVDHLFLLVQALLLNYAIYDRNILDLPLVVRMNLSFLFVSLMTVLALIIALLAFILNMHTLVSYFAVVYSAVIALLLIVVFLFLRSRFEIFFDLLFYPERARIYLAVNELIRMSAEETKIEDVFEKIGLICKKSLSVKDVFFFLKDTDGNYYIEKSSSNPIPTSASLHQENPIIKMLENEQSSILLSDALLKPQLQGLWKEELEVINTYDIKSFFPLITKSKVFGIMCLTSRITNRPYTQHFMQMAQYFAQQCAILINNTILYDEVKKAAIIDPLTGAYNRRMLEDSYTLDGYEEDLSVGMIITDVNNFKHINDQYGHQAGDLVLRELTDVMKNSVRDQDLVVRFGGDEFIVLMPGAEPYITKKVVSRIERNLEKWNKKQKYTNGEEVSLKIGTYTAAGESMDKLVYEADQKLLVANHDHKQQQLAKLLNESVRDRKTLTEQAVLALAKSTELGDPYTSGHSERVMAYALKIAEKLGLVGPQIEALRHAAILHDIGKIGIHKNVLLKEGPLNKEEWELMKLHPVMGAQILAKVKQFEDMADIVRHHHERYDGDLNASPPAYPDGLKGEDIPLLTRIITVADAFDAMISSRPYRPAISLDKVKEIFENEAGKQFDRNVTIALFSCLESEDFIEEKI